MSCIWFLVDFWCMNKMGFFDGYILGLFKKCDFQQKIRHEVEFKSEIFDRRNGLGRSNLGQESTSVSFIYFTWNLIHKYGIVSHQTYLSCSSMSRWKWHERERCQSRNGSQEPGHKVGFHREWLNMRHVVWGQDPAVMGSFITVSRTGTENWRQSVDRVQITQ